MHTRTTHTHTQSQNYTRTSSTQTQKNSGAQQWLCTRSAYTIFHHYCGEKKHSTIDLPHCFLFSLSLSLSPTLRFRLLFLLFTSLFLLLCHAQKFASITRLFLKWIPVVNKIINMQTPLRSYLPNIKLSYTCIQKHTDAHRRWTQYCEHLCNRMQPSIIALQ